MNAKLVYALVWLVLASNLMLPSEVHASKRNAAKCIDAATDKYESNVRKGLKIAGHKFNCHHVDIVRQNQRESNGNDGTVYREGSWQYKGKLSHVLRFRKDDQIHYRISFEKRRKLRTRFRDYKYTCRTTATKLINRGGFAPIVGAAGRVIGKDDWEQQWRNAAKDFDSRKKKKWENVADDLIAGVATELKKQAGCNERINRRKRPDQTGISRPVQ